MTSIDAGNNASSSRNEEVSSKPPISPAARKLAEYIARRMRPMIKAHQERTISPALIQQGQPNDPSQRRAAG